MSDIYVKAITISIPKTVAQSGEYDALVECRAVRDEAIEHGATAGEAAESASASALAAQEYAAQAAAAAALVPTVGTGPDDVPTNSTAGAAYAPISHVSDTGNPHATTAAQVGAISTSLLGEPGGVATLDGGGTIPESQLPVVGLEFSRVTGTGTLLANTVHRCYVTGNATLSLPSSPSDGEYLEVWDCGRTFSSHTVVVSGTVRGDSDGITIDNTGSRTAFVFDSTTGTWQDSSVLGG